MGNRIPAPSWEAELPLPKEMGGLRARFRRELRCDAEVMTHELQETQESQTSHPRSLGGGRSAPAPDRLQAKGGAGGVVNLSLRSSRSRSATSTSPRSRS
jgi:hypothetical protein